MNEAFRHPLNQNMICLYKLLIKPSNVKLNLDTRIAETDKVSDTLV